MEIHNKLRDSRIKLGLTQKKVANDLGFSVSTITKYESGEKKAPPMKYVNYLASKGIDKDWLLEGEGFYTSQVNLSSSIVASRGAVVQGNRIGDSISNEEHIVKKSISKSKQISLLEQRTLEQHDKLKEAEFAQKNLHEKLEEAESRIEDLKSYHEKELLELHATYQKKVAELNQANDRKLQEISEIYQQRIDDLKTANQHTIDTLKESYERELKSKDSIIDTLKSLINK